MYLRMSKNVVFFQSHLSIFIFKPQFHQRTLAIQMFFFSSPQGFAPDQQKEYKSRYGIHMDAFR